VRFWPICPVAWLWNKPKPYLCESNAYLVVGRQNIPRLEPRKRFIFNRLGGIEPRAEIPRVGGSIHSSQSRAAKMEAGDPTVSLDLLVKSLLALGASNRDLRQINRSSLNGW
jgi:hypothetical protein